MNLWFLLYIPLLIQLKVLSIRPEKHADVGDGNRKEWPVAIVRSS